jgi:hypothetical protein
MPEAAPPALNVVTPGQGAGAPAGDSTASALAAALTPPATVDTTMDKGAQTNTTTTETTPEIDKGLADISDARARATAANAEKADQTVLLAEQQAKAEDQKAALAAQLAERRRIKAEEDQRLVDAAVAQEKQRRAAMDATSTMHSFWGPESQGAPARVFANVMAALADYAHLRAGGQGPSVASEYIEGEIAKDRQHKIDLFTRAKEFQQLAAKDVDHARDVLADHLRQLDAEGQVQRDKLTAMLEAQLSRSKIPMAKAEAQKLRAETDQKNAESEVKTRETFAAKVAKEGARQDRTHTANNKDAAGKETKPTESESRTASYAEGIEEAVDGLKKTNPKDISSGLTKAKSNDNRMVAADKTSQSGIVPSFLVESVARGTDFAPSSKLHGMTDPEQAAVAGVRRWNAFVLHDLTGAAASAGEDADVTAGFTVGPDDSPATVQSKLAGGMKLATKLKLLSGPAAQARLHPPAAKPAAEAPKPPAKAPSRHADAAALLKWLQSNPKADPEKRAQVRETLRKLNQGE